MRKADLTLAALLCTTPLGGQALGQAPGPFEMRFQFDQNGTPSIHTFVLKWASSDANLQTIDVVVSDTNEVIQTITLPQDGIKLVYNELINVSPNTIKDQFIDNVDYDFDKYADLRLTREWPYKVGAKYYMVWLFDEEKNQYVLNEAISALQGPVANAKTQRIESTTLGGFAGGEYDLRSYSINELGKLKVQGKVTQRMVSGKPLHFTRDVRLRQAGELQRVCKIEIPPEGLPKKIWGRRDTCAPYMIKDLE